MSFARRYFGGPASLVAGAFFVTGVLLAYLSHTPSDWWRGFLQDSSTTALGLSVSVLVIQFLLDLQRERLDERLREAREVSLTVAVRSALARLERWLPRIDIPDLAHVAQLDWAREQIDQLKESGRSLSNDVHDDQYRRILDLFVAGCDSLSESLFRMSQLIKNATVERRETGVRALEAAREEFRADAESLLSELDRRYAAAKPVLRIRA